MDRAEPLFYSVNTESVSDFSEKLLCKKMVKYCTMNPNLKKDMIDAFVGLGFLRP